MKQIPKPFIYACEQWGRNFYKTFGSSNLELIFDFYINAAKKEWPIYPLFVWAVLGYVKESGEVPKWRAEMA